MSGFQTERIEDGKSHDHGVTILKLSAASYLEYKTRYKRLYLKSRCLQRDLIISDKNKLDDVYKVATMSLRSGHCSNISM